MKLKLTSWLLRFTSERRVESCRSSSRTTLLKLGHEFKESEWMRSVRFLRYTEKPIWLNQTTPLSAYRRTNFAGWPDKFSIDATENLELASFLNSTRFVCSYPKTKIFFTSTECISQCNVTIAHFMHEMALDIQEFMEIRNNWREHRAFLVS